MVSVLYASVSSSLVNKVKIDVYRVQMKKVKIEACTKSCDAALQRQGPGVPMSMSCLVALAVICAQGLEQDDAPLPSECSVILAH